MKSCPIESNPSKGTVENDYDRNDYLEESSWDSHGFWKPGCNDVTPEEAAAYYNAGTELSKFGEDQILPEHYVREEVAEEDPNRVKPDNIFNYEAYDYDGHRIDLTKLLATARAVLVVNINASRVWDANYKALNDMYNRYKN